MATRFPTHLQKMCLAHLYLKTNVCAKFHENWLKSYWPKFTKVDSAKRTVESVDFTESTVHGFAFVIHKGGFYRIHGFNRVHYVTISSQLFGVV